MDVKSFEVVVDGCRWFWVVVGGCRSFLLLVTTLFVDGSTIRSCCSVSTIANLFPKC